MSIRNWTRIVCLVAVMGLCVTGCKKEESAGDKVGKAVDKAVEKTGEAVEKTGEAVEKTGEKIQDSTK